MCWSIFAAAFNIFEIRNNLQLHPPRLAGMKKVEELEDVRCIRPYTERYMYVDRITVLVTEAFDRLKGNVCTQTAVSQ